MYASSAPSATVVSVDDDEEWLKRTSRFLTDRSMSGGELIAWEDFKRRSEAPFDFVFHDLGCMETRRKELRFILDLATKRTGIVILDDMHKPHYATFVRLVLTAYRHKYCTLRPYTVDQFGRYADAVFDINRHMD
jgi:predicted O-methyltransferase YrrM